MGQAHLPAPTSPASFRAEIELDVVAVRRPAGGNGVLAAIVFGVGGLYVAGVALGGSLPAMLVAGPLAAVVGAVLAMRRPTFRLARSSDGVLCATFGGPLGRRSLFAQITGDSSGAHLLLSSDDTRAWLMGVNLVGDDDVPIAIAPSRAREIAFMLGLPLVVQRPGGASPVQAR